MWEGVGDRTELQHNNPHSIGHNCVLSRSLGLLNRGPEGPLCWVLAFSTASCHQRVWSPNWSGLQLVRSPNWSGLQLTDFLSSLSYMIVQRPLLVGVTIAFIQSIHGQGYNSDNPRLDAPVIYIGAFSILTVRPGCRSIYNKDKLQETSNRIKLKQRKTSSYKIHVQGV